MLAVKTWPALAMAAALLLLAAACGQSPTGANPPTANPTAAPAATAAIDAPAATAAANAAPTPTATRPALPSPTVAAPPTAAAPVPTAAPTSTAARTPPLSPTSAPATAPSLLQLAAPLDEPEFYCVDVPGFRDSLRTDRPLQAHTCKPGAADELFLADQPETGRFLMPAYDLCITAEDDRVYTRPCAATAAQRFVHRDDLTIRTADGDLCLAVAGGDGEPAGGRSHLRRDLRLTPCAAAEPALSQWIMPGRNPQ